MEKLLTNAQMRAADDYTINKLNIPSQTLMRRAGERIAEEAEKIIRLKGIKNTVVVCGTGNNGGDGFVCAKLLFERGYGVSVYEIKGNLSADCAREKAEYNGAYTDELKAELIIDCIFGTGLARKVEGLYAEVIKKINSSGAFVISADIPSGLDGDSGRILGCAVKAHLTVAIAEYKTGHFLCDGLDYCGEVVKKDIGIVCPQKDYAVKLSDNDTKAFYPTRRRNTHKGSYGSANIIAGSEKYIGAAALSLNGALMSGCGYVKLTSPEKVKTCLAPNLPQVIYLDEADLTSNAIAVGMGCGVSRALYDSINGILKNFRGTLIIDADGLNSIAEYGADILLEKNCNVILTPHVKEFSRLTKKSVDEILSNPLNLARQFANKYGVTLLLKGAASIITDGGRTVINVRGTSALSKGGSGDIMSGYMCGCAARGLSAFDAAACAAYTLGISAEISSEQKTDYCTTAEDIIKNLHTAVMRLTK